MLELVCGVLSVIVRDDDGAHHEVALHKLVAQSEHILVVGDAEVGTNLVLLDVVGADHNHDLYRVSQLGEHAELGVGLESWQHTRGVVVVEEFAAQFHIELAVELRNALTDVLRLYLEVLVVIESYFHFFMWYLFPLLS